MTTEDLLEEARGIIQRARDVHKVLIGPGATSTSLMEMNVFLEKTAPKDNRSVAQRIVDHEIWPVVCHDEEQEIYGASPPLEALKRLQENEDIY